MRTMLAIKGILIVAVASALAHAASLDKARALLENGFSDEAKKEFIEVVYAPDATSNDKAESLYLIGKVNMQQGRLELAKKNWQTLLKKYPSSPKAGLARKNLLESTPFPSSDLSIKDREGIGTPSQEFGSNREAFNITKQSDFRLVSSGAPPRYPLRYTVSATHESGVFWAKLALLEGDCPKKPSKEKYPSFETEVSYTILTSPDTEQGVIRADVSWKSESVESPSNRRDVEVGSDWIRFQPNGKVIGSSDSEASLSDFGLSTFPLEPVGVGARWEAPITVGGGTSTFVFMSTNTVESIDSDSARLRSELYIDATLEGEGQKAHFQGGGDGTVIWQAGRVLPPGSSSAVFMRITKIAVNQQDDPENIACMLMRSGTK